MVVRAYEPVRRCPQDALCLSHGTADGACLQRTTAEADTRTHVPPVRHRISGFDGPSFLGQQGHGNDLPACLHLLLLPHDYLVRGTRRRVRLEAEGCLFPWPTLLPSLCRPFPPCLSVYQLDCSKRIYLFRSLPTLGSGTHHACGLSADSHDIHLRYNGQ